MPSSAVGMLLEGVPGIGRDALGENAGGMRMIADVLGYSVHARPDARGHHRDDGA